MSAGRLAVRSPAMLPAMLVGRLAVRSPAMLVGRLAVRSPAMSEDHTPEAYRALFALIGAGLQFTALVFILASWLVAPWWVVGGLLGVWLVTTVWSWLGWPKRVWLPTATGTVVAVLWIAALALLRR